MTLSHTVTRQATIGRYRTCYRMALVVAAVLVIVDARPDLTREIEAGAWRTSMSKRIWRPDTPYVDDAIVVAWSAILFGIDATREYFSTRIGKVSLH